jgi:hypothetical protein
MFVIVNDEGELYYGFDSDSCKPVWKKTKREGCAMPEQLADAALKQLKALGHEKIVKRPANGVIRKWVPADLDASAA